MHWVGDTSALIGKPVLWNEQETWPYGVFHRWGFLWVGDPYLTAGLLKDGDPIYLVKWEHHWEVPKLLHIQSIKDVELFGINARNYGNFVVEKSDWEAKYGLDADTLVREPLQAATWGRWRKSTRDFATWPGITLYRNRDILIEFRCRRGTDQWEARIPVPSAAANRFRLVEIVPRPPHGEQAQSMLWRYDGAGEAYWRDTQEHPYARQLLDLTLKRHRQAEELYIDLPGVTSQGQPHVLEIWWLAGIETAVAWLRAECAKQR